MGRYWAIPLAQVEEWYRWFDGMYYVRLFRDDPQAIEELKQRIDPMFWADEFITQRLNGLIQEANETVLIQVREHRTANLPAGFVPVTIWPIPFEKGRSGRDRGNLWKKVFTEFETHGLKDVTA